MRAQIFLVLAPLTYLSVWR